MRNHYVINALALTALLVSPAFALTLFDPERGAVKETPIVPAPVVPTTATEPQKEPLPELSLLAVSRLGEKRQILLRLAANTSAKAQRFSFSGQPISLELEGLNGSFTLLEVAAQEVRLHYPKHYQCQDSDKASQAEMQCLADSQIRLKLGRFTREASNPEEPQTTAAAPQPNHPTKPQTPENPFAFLNSPEYLEKVKKRREEAEAAAVKRKEANKNEVPPGFEEVVTPFGSHLREIQ